MPLVGGGNAVTISFDGDAADLIAASNDVIKAINLQKEAVKKAGKDIEAAAKAEAAAVKQAAQSQKQSWTEVRSAYSTVLDVLRAGKAVFDFAKEGAQIEFVQKKFENLSQSIGTTSEVLLGDLRTATQGMYSDMELMASATDFVGLGLANTREEAVRLATVSAGLNMNMNQLVLTLTNMTTMRFDALGVRVDGFKEKVDALKESGMDADAAFKEAFLQQAEAQLALVGNAADSTAGAFMQLEANIANAGNQAKIVASSMFAPLVNKMNEVSEATNKVQTDTEAYNVKMAETGGQLVLTRFQYNASKDKILEYANALDRAAASEAHIARDDVVASVQEEAEAFGMTAEQSKQYMSVLDKISGETEKFTEKTADLNDKLADLETQLAGEREGSDAYKKIQGDIEDTKAAVSDLAEEHAKASKSMMFDLISQQAAAEGFKNISVEALAALGEQWGVLAKGSGDATSTMISQAEAWTQALSGVPGEIQSIADMWANLRELSKNGITLTANVVSQATGGAMGGQNTMTQCFTGDTLVSMADGSSVAIKDVRVGDVVLSHDTNSGQNIKTVVVETFEHPASDGGRLLLINGYLKVTPEHLLFNGHTWQPAGEFAAGDVLINLDGSHMRVVSVREIVKNEPVYNIHVDHEVHNYYAGGVLVHNAKQNDVTTQWRGGTVGSFAKGGAGGGWGIVGDKQGGGWVDGVSELVYGNFKVFPSKQAKGMLKSGALGKVPGFAFGGNSEDFGGMTGGAAVRIPYVPTPTPKTKGGGGSAMEAVQAIQSQAVDMQASTQNAVVQMATITQQMTQNILKSNTQTQEELQRIAGILLHENPTAVGSAVAYKVALKSA